MGSNIDRAFNKQNYNLMSERHQSGYMPWDRTGNRLLVQSSLGKNKPTNYNIPEENFVYGRGTPIDPEKANEVMYEWKYHNNSQNKNVGMIKDIINTNKQALRNKATNSSTNYNFRKTQTVYKTCREGSKNVKIYLPEDNFTYGKPGELEDPIKLVMANDYGETDKILRHTMYQMMQSSTPGQPDKRKLSCHITKSHQLVKEAQNKRMAMFDWTRRTSSKDYWKLNKFQNVPAKVQPNRDKKSKSQFRDEESHKSNAGNSQRISQGLTESKQ